MLASDGEILTGMVVDFGAHLITTMVLDSTEEIELHTIEVLEIEVLGMHMQVIIEIVVPSITGLEHIIAIIGLVTVHITTEILIITEEEFLPTTIEEQETPHTQMGQDHETITHILDQDPALLIEAAQEHIIAEVDQEVVPEREIILALAEAEVLIALPEVVVLVAVADLVLVEVEDPLEVEEEEDKIHINQRI